LSVYALKELIPKRCDGSKEIGWRDYSRTFFNAVFLDTVVLATLLSVNALNALVKMMFYKR